ncbi:MAG: hypothetical protein AB7O65_12680 [Candidatus Korobacteraceae bacterium]
MAFLQKSVAVATRRMPKMISPRGHAVADYVNVGVFFVMGALFWRRNPRAAAAAFAAGLAEASTSLMTDYPGGVANIIDFPTHRTLDAGLAALTFALPNVMTFSDTPESRYFRLMGLNLTAVTELTDFEQREVVTRRKAA